MAKTKHFGALAAAAGALVAVALLVLMLVLVNPQTAGAALPGQNGRIAYSGYDPNQLDREIFTIPATGGTPSQLTDNLTGDVAPCYSPDGNTIGYIGATANGDQIFTGQIFTMPATGGLRQQVTPDTVDNPGSCSFTGPRGTHIVYYAPSGAPTPKIFTILVPAPGAPPGTPNQVTSISDGLAPSFTAVGKRIAYSGRERTGGDLEIFTIPATGGTPSQLTDNSTEDLDPDYSPDGSRIVYTRPDGDGDREIFTISATGGTPSQLTNNGTTDQWPVYSPDGSRIAYSSNDGGDFEIFTMPATGGQRQQVTFNLRDDIQPSWQPRPAASGTKVPEVVGFSSSGAGRAIRNAGLVPKFTGDPQGANAWVVSQKPSAGTLVDPGSTVTCRLTNKGDPF